MPVSDKPMAYKEFAAIKAQLVTELQLTPREWLQILGTNIDSAGTPQNLLNTSGYVTEASAASTQTNTTYIWAELRSMIPPTFASPDFTSSTPMGNVQRRIACVLMVTDGSGNCAATTIVPALAGYTGHALIYGLTSTVADAAGTYTWAVAAGTILGPSAFTMQVAAGQFTFFSAAVPNVCGVGLPIRGTVAADDNKAITLAIANGAATSTHWVYVEYWYET